MALPMLDIESIGAGGGSIAWIDEAGRLNVGPRSAGARPGPACYGFGGTDATVTDADVVLGLVDPDNYLGGRMQLDRDLAEEAVDRLASRLGMSRHETAAGISTVVDAKMADLVRRMSLLRGLDPRNFACAAFGGGGPVHAPAVAAQAAISRVIVPLPHAASVLSAYGAATSDVVHVVQRWRVVKLPVAGASVEEIFAALERDAHEKFARQGIDTDGVTLERSVRMRFSMQIHDVEVPVPVGHIDDERGAADRPSVRGGARAAVRAGFRAIALAVSTSPPSRSERPRRRVRSELMPDERREPARRLPPCLLVRAPRLPRHAGLRRGPFGIDRRTGADRVAGHRHRHPSRASAAKPDAAGNYVIDLAGAGTVSARFEGKVALVTGGGIGNRRGDRRAGSRRTAPASSSWTCSRRRLSAWRANSRRRPRSSAMSPIPKRQSERSPTLSRRSAASHVAANIAGIGGPLISSEEYPIDDWRKVIDINLSGVYYSVRAELRHMLANGGGSIVNMASMFSVVARDSMVAYVAAKHGVLGITRAAAIDCAGRGVRVNCVGPAVIQDSPARGVARPGRCRLPRIAEPVRPARRARTRWRRSWPGWPATRPRSSAEASTPSTAPSRRDEPPRPRRRRDRSRPGTGRGDRHGGGGRGRHRRRRRSRPDSAGRPRHDARARRDR